MTGQMPDKIKISIASACVLAGVVGYYLIPNSPTVVRLAALLGGIVIGAVVAWFSEPGQQFFAYAKDSVTETKKVAWPTRKESLQTTGVVFLFVVIMAVFLWISDKSLEALLYDVILGWKKS